MEKTNEFKVIQLAKGKYLYFYSDGSKIEETDEFYMDLSLKVAELSDSLPAIYLSKQNTFVFVDITENCSYLSWPQKLEQFEKIGLAISTYNQEMRKTRTNNLPDKNIFPLGNYVLARSITEMRAFVLFKQDKTPVDEKYIEVIMDEFLRCYDIPFLEKSKKIYPEKNFPTDKFPLLKKGYSYLIDENQQFAAISFSVPSHLFVEQLYNSCPPLFKRTYDNFFEQIANHDIGELPAEQTNTTKTNPILRIILEKVKRKQEIKK